MAAQRQANLPKFLGVSLVGGGLAATGLGWLYGWATAMNPFIYFNIAGLFILGGAIGLAIHTAAEVADLEAGPLVPFVALAFSGVAIQGM